MLFKLGSLVLGALSGTPDKTEKRSKGFLGGTVTRTRYNDTGKETKTVTRKGFFGGTVSKTYVTKEGRRK